MSATEQQTIDFDARYRVDGYRGIAWFLWGYATRIDILNDEEVEDMSHVVATMVGDDRKFTFHVDEIHVIGELDYCASCGQIGCTADGRDRT